MLLTYRINTNADMETFYNQNYNIETVWNKLQYFWALMWRPNSGKNSDTGKDWEQEEKGATEDEVVGWYHWLNGHEFEQSPGDSEGQGSLACCNPCDCKESDMTWLLNSQRDKKQSPIYHLLDFFQAFYQMPPCAISFNFHRNPVTNSSLCFHRWWNSSSERLIDLTKVTGI